jgi:TolA-binding protein
MKLTFVATAFSLITLLSSSVCGETPTLALPTPEPQESAEPSINSLIGVWEMKGDVPSRRFEIRNGVIFALYLLDKNQGIPNSGSFPIIWRGKFDGVDQPVYTQNLDSALVGKLNSTNQTRAYTAIDPRTTEIVVKVSGRVIVKVTMQVSVDGETLTETVRAVDKKGQITSTSTLVFGRGKENATLAQIRKEREGYGYFDRGRAHSDKGELDLAIQDFTRALSLLPNDEAIYRFRGIAYYQKGDFELAIQDFTKGVSSARRPNAATYLGRAKAYCALGKFELAILDFTEFISTYPSAASAYQERAKAYRALGKSDMADADEKKARELSEKKP